MPSSSTQCHPELLQQSLSDQLTEQQEEWLAVHLAECEACRAALGSLAGSRDDWARIESALRNEQSGDRAFTEAAESAVSGNRFIVDFAVDFLEPAGDSDALGRLGNIEIREVIGQGGNGIVLKGFQSELNRLVAAKVMAPHLATSAAARRRFAREAQATAAIVHPSVMPILSVNSEGRLPYLVMPYVDCESLQQRIDREGALPTIDILRIGVQVARGLAAAHAQGLVHRDVKPANILLERGVDRVMLTDFGLARAIDDASLTRSGVIAGTPQYMSPEQARGEPVDARSDLFSLGSVLYAICTGRPPFRAETSYGILRRVTDDEARSIREINSDLPSWLDSIVQRLLSKSPDDRFANAETVAELLEECVAHVQQPTVNPLPVAIGELTTIGRSRIRAWWLVAGSAVVMSVLIATAVLPEQKEPVNDQSVSTTNETVIPAPIEEQNAESNAWISGADLTLKQLDAEINQLLEEMETQ